MKTKKEICAEANITPVTLLSWRREGLIPDPSGIRGREATWPDDILARIHEIQRLKGLGLSLADIRARFDEDAKVERLVSELNAAKAAMAHLEAWDDAEKIKTYMPALLGIKRCGSIAHMTGGFEDNAYSFVTVSNGDTVYLTKVLVSDPEARVVDSIRLNIEEYSEIVSRFCLLQAHNGDIFDIRDLAFRAFMWPDDFDDIRKFVEATLKIRSMGQAVLEDVLKLKAKTDLSSLE
jgi:DNA-binding transcriptional MerR regulator